MRIFSYDLLDYLHDALLVSLSFFVAEDGLRRCRLVAVCDGECGYDAWAGKTIEFLFLDVLICSGTLLGHVAGPEHLDGIRQELPPDALKTVSELAGQGVREPRAQLTIVLQSGSRLALAYDRLEVLPVPSIT